MCLSQRVLDSLRGQLATRNSLRVLEIGAGIGTMPARLIDLGIIAKAEYMMLDSDLSSLERGWEYLDEWASSRGIESTVMEDGMKLTGNGIDCEIRGVHKDAIEFARTWNGRPFGLLIAHLFLDLIDVRSHLQLFLDLLEEGGVFYFSSNFDGMTSILPSDDRDAMMIEAYHSVMDHKSLGWGYPRSRTGSQIISLLLRMDDVDLVDAAASDWVVIPRKGSYTRNEGDFLHFMIDTIGNALKEDHSIDFLEDWVVSKHRQVDEGRMVFIVHQIDVLGMRRRHP